MAISPAKRVATRHDVNLALQGERVRTAQGLRRVLGWSFLCLVLQALLLVATLFVIHGSRA